MSQAKFEAAVNVIRSLPKDGPYQPSNDMMLKFYGLYKQATEGPCKDPKPSFYEMVKGYKWKAWSSLGNLSKEDAMEQYVAELKKIVETMSYSDKVADFIDAVGPFYEYVQVLQLKNTDTNHNTTEKCFEKKSENSFEVISKCNGQNNGTEIQCVNGIANHDSNSYLTIDDSKQIIEKNKLTNGVSDTNSSEKDLCASKVVNLVCQINNGKEESDLSESEDAVSSFLARKLTSDTDSDDEYSEPAETPELLYEKQKAKPVNKEDIEIWAQNGDGDYVEYPSNSPKLEIVTYGGGDVAEAGRIRLTTPQSNEQGSASTSHSGRDLLPLNTQNHRRSSAGGSGGGRRRRDSERGRISEDINTQLILLLQKIHQDLQAVVQRLDSLEAQALSQHQEVCTLCQRRFGRSCSPSETSWWPFPELSPRSTFFLLTWPFILHGAVKLLILLRSKRRSARLST